MKNQPLNYASPEALAFKDAADLSSIEEGLGIALVGELVKVGFMNSLRQHDYPTDPSPEARTAYLQLRLDRILIDLWNRGLLWRDDVRLVATSDHSYEWRAEPLPETVGRV